MWLSAPATLSPKKPKRGRENFERELITRKLAKAPERLSQKAVVPKVAARKEPRSTRKRERVKAELALDF